MPRILVELLKLKKTNQKLGDIYWKKQQQRERQEHNKKRAQTRFLYTFKRSIESHLISKAYTMKIKQNVQQQH